MGVFRRRGESVPFLQVFQSELKRELGKMVSMVAKTLKDKRQYDALVDIFQEADTSNDGKISVEEYMAILDLYRIEISDEEILEVAQMADSNGEIGRDEFLRYIQKS